MTAATPHRFLFLLGAAWRRVHQVAKRGDVPGAARSGLLMAIAAEGTPMAAVARTLDLGASTLTGLVDRAVAEGLIVRIADTADRRACRLALTEAGADARGAAVARAHAMNARVAEGFTPEELDTVVRWLEAVRTRFPEEDR